MFKKEDNVKYLIGGAAVGVAGLVVGKLLLPSISTSESRKFGSNQCMREHSQDDNILYSQKHVQYCYPRSKSTSCYEDMNTTNLAPVVLLKGTQVNKENINDLASGHKSNTNSENKPCNNENFFHNISVEDNLCDVCTARSQKDNQYSKLHNLVKPCSDQKSSEKDSMNNLSKVNSKVSMAETHAQKEKFDSKQNTNTSFEKSRSHGLSKTFSNLTNVLCIDDNIISGNFSSFKDYVSNPFILDDCVQGFVSSITETDNISTLAVCNSIPNIEEDDDKMLNYTSPDEFHETDLISSTKRNNLGDL